MSLIPYASTIGSIMHSMICTRLDVSYALSITNRYQSDLCKGHWVDVKNILKYLIRTNDVFLIYEDGDSDLHVNRYTDANFQHDRDASKSQ